MGVGAAVPTARRGPASAAAEAAGARGRLYGLLSRAVAFPEPEFHRDVGGRRWFEELSALCAELPYRLRPGEAAAWRVAGDYDAFQSEYIRLFELGGRGGAPSPLYSGHYGGDRLRTLEELVRFYNFFALRTSPGLMPDHASVELEFMQYLAAGAAEEDGGESRASYLRAQRDFLARHLSSWWPRLAEKARRQRPQRFYRSLISFVGRFLESERKHLEQASESI